MYNIVGKRNWFFAFSVILILLGAGAMVYSAVQFGSPLRIGVDFTGGSRFEIQFTEPAAESAIRAVFIDLGLDPTIQQLGEKGANTWQIRSTFVDPEQVEQILNNLTDQVAPVDRELSRYDTVSPSVGGEVTQAAALAVVVASVIVLLFVWFSFRRVPHAFRYGACAIAGMLHNLLIATGFFALMGLLRGWEVDALFLTAILTVVGFSVQDTIVVFDRIRENLLKTSGAFEDIVERSVNETMARSINTSVTTFFPLLAIFMFGGDTIKWFAMTMMIGLIAGTYSSIFLASPLLVVFQKKSRR